MSVAVIQSKITGAYVKDFMEDHVLLTSDVNTALRFYYPSVAKLEMFNNELPTENYEVVYVD